jgi:hypothetical protein
MTKLKSFGCSFIYGSDLLGVDRQRRDEPNSSQETWPALIAKKLNLDYECHAWPGQGNFKIFCDILANSYRNDDSVYVVNWTWIDRFDYVDSQEHWNTLRPAQENELQDFYYRNLHNQLNDMISSASWIVSAAEHLRSLERPFVMTYMDYNLLTPLDPNWHDPRYLEILQQKLNKILKNFNGLNFLDWSKKHNYEINQAWHPLEAAHRGAADYWLPHIQRLV